MTGRPPKYRNKSNDTAYTYNSWVHMLDRCYNPNAVQFSYYGGRGIGVCERWRASYDAFYDDMGARPHGLTLERQNNDGNYEPGNCRWATRTEQSQNRRERKDKGKERPVPVGFYSIGEMSRAGCTTARGIRFWEEQGLLGEVGRSSGDTRRYTDAQMDRARIIAAAQFGAFPLDDIKGMLDEWGPEAHAAILVRLSDQMRAAARLAENLPSVPVEQEYDL